MKLLVGVIAICLSLFVVAGAWAATLEEDLEALARGWDHAAYEISDQDSQIAALTLLEAKADELLSQYPRAAGPLAWKAIIISTKANAADGLKALGFAEAARKQLEKVIVVDPDPFGDGSLYAMLGALYDGAPGFPLGFGDKGKAQKHLRKALDLCPAGADANYFYGVYLVGQKQYREAKRYLQMGLNAPPRPKREIGDKGRKADIRDQLAAVEAKLSLQ